VKYKPPLEVTESIKRVDRRKEKKKEGISFALRWESEFKNTNTVQQRLKGDWGMMTEP